MSQTRQILLRTLAARYSPGTRLEGHTHTWGQLVYGSEGVMTVSSAEGSWVVPSHRAVWIPAGIEHSVDMAGFVFLRSLYLPGEPQTGLPTRCCVVQVSPLLRELILRAVAIGVLWADETLHRHLLDFLLDQLHALSTVPLGLPMPRDTRALRVAQHMREHPGDGSSLDALARHAGASRRTLERLFLDETGLTFGRWRQQARLLEALRLLAAGQPVTSVALDVGYANPSAFIAMFRSALGTTPARYYADQRAATSVSP